MVIPHLLPRTCIACDTPVRTGVGWPVCDRCLSASLPALLSQAANTCAICSIPLPPRIGVCERCRREEFAFDRLLAVAPYRGLYSAIIRAFKFRGRTSLVPLIAELMQPTLARLDPNAILVPAPSSRRRVRARGFAGADLIARALGRETRRPVVSLLTTQEHPEQKRLDYEGRKRNARTSVRTISESSRRLLDAGGHCIVVDDIATTGTTADACARALRASGAHRVEVVVFAMEY